MKAGLLKKISVVVMTIIMLMMPTEVLAVEGTLGYEGGISAVNTNVKNGYYYTEMCFVSGKPIYLTGTLTIDKRVRNNVETATYTYMLANAEEQATLERVIIYETVSETKPNGQITESTRLSTTTSRPFREQIDIGGTQYILSEYSFSKSLLTDPKPAINYYAGEFAGRKVYRINNNSNNTVTVGISGKLYAYDQYWSSTQTQKIQYTLETRILDGNTPYQWGGSAEVTVSTTRRQQIKYAENEPWQISFDGGYVRRTWEEAILDYHARLPEFDSNNMPTPVIKDYKSRTNITVPPVLERLMVPDIRQLDGHWAQEPVSILFGLGVIPGTGENYNINKYVTRREFVVMLMQAVRDIPEAPKLKTSTITTNRNRSKTVEVSPFLDVSVDDPDYALIKRAYEKKIITGTGNSYFQPDAYVTYAEAIKMIVNALGLENLAPPYSNTPYVDNDSIPAYARNAAAVAYSLGIFQGDERGYFNPSGRITNEQAAKLFYNLIRYMGDELVKDYADRMLSF
ncbi:S-layer homology domain-containing protein [Thermoclostridium caenicola]|uniref:S-layer homology domain-containing protein n=1 Tax=Thermoclostridium caenicola TaxID=659425 RepID=A0A1M6GZP7_9FIRM|nr:S-layer homology domain-containing protein [Thermoclostridium caenicola]SHJ15408.1 S-layer homology domain-containing protein [Thermoclostridium caenicola]